MTDSTEQPEPTMITRDAMDQQVRGRMLGHPQLISSAEPLERLNILGNYKSNLVARANLLTRIALDAVFDGADMLPETVYNERVLRLHETKGAALAQRFDNATGGSPFSAGMKFYAPDLLRGTLDAMLATLTVEPPAPAKHTARKSVLPTSAVPNTTPTANLRDAVHDFFAALPEMHKSSLGGHAKALQQTVDQRIDMLTDAVMPLLSRSGTALDADLADMGKPESELVTAIATLLTSHVGEYPRSVFSVDKGIYNADKTAQSYAHKLCDHLGKCMQVTTVAAAAADPHAPGTQALTKALAGKEKRLH